MDKRRSITMKTFAVRTFIVFVLFAAPAVCVSAAQQGSRPNIVLILADDFGYMDVGANNPKTFYETPHLDALARRGMRFTQGYAACPVCSPTRASLMTGKYPPRTGITDFIPGMRNAKLRSAPNAGQLRLEEITLAERLRDGGYATFMAGKWHLGAGEFAPAAQGFENKPAGQGQFYYPKDDQAAPDNENDPKTTDRIANAAVRFITAQKDKPFFAYLPFLAVHVPIKAPKDLVEKYEKKKSNAAPDNWGKEGNSKVRLVQNHASYAAMLEQMDSAIGRVLSAIEREGHEDRTIVIFISDNGGLATAEGSPTSNLPLRAGKGWLYEGGIRIPWIVRVPGLTKAGTTCDTPVITMDFYPTLLELAGLPPFPEQHQDGMSLVPLLAGRPLQRGPLFWHYPHYGNQGGAPAGAVRDGRWKFIEWYEDGRRELFNLQDDPSEQKNLAAKEPEKVNQLASQLSRFRADVKAIMPTPNPEWDGGKK